ncbi:ribosome recycling factor [Fluviispira sanaruensis]|uniref:Ribosome-recycling factor n=1 Tax=Fluviispira sanaruensis TaxID=2493639 RepID=A0A4P2VM87_FLUSA|nr:ribosome recycling factor [Fluviispira sanaruensis]BBH52549.1 ribosome recycling factor [Fluviispira sanaruensis]
MDKKQLVEKVKEGMEKTINSLKSDLQKIRTGRASAALLDDVRVDSYGTQMPLSKVATLATPEARLITVNPFDKSMLPVVEKAILTSGLGLTPNNDGKVIRIPIPALSEERRKEIAKQVKKIGEEAKVAVRHHRQDGNTKAKASQKEHGWSEDEVKRASDEVQKLTDTYAKKVDELCVAKEKEVLTM